MTFPPYFIYRSKISPLGTRFLEKAGVPLSLRPPEPILAHIHVYAPEGWQLDLDQKEQSEALTFHEWITTAREYQTRFPSEAQKPELPATASDLPTGTIFVVHCDQPFALTPPAELPGYETFSHALGPYRGRLVKDFDLNGAVDIPIDEWFTLADEAERKAYVGGFRPELVLKQPLRPSDFPVGTKFYTKEEELPFVILPDGSEFSWLDGHPREWREYTGSPHVIMSRKVTFEVWLKVVEESVRECSSRIGKGNP